MRSISRILRNTPSVLLLLALAAGAVWLIAQSRPRPPDTVGVALAPFSAAPSQQSPLATPTASRHEPTQAPPRPTATPTEAIRLIPLCTFPGGAPPDRGGPSLDKYEFGEPRVVITNTFALDIAGWLPDSRRLLVIRSGPGGALIETVDVHSNARTVYGVQQSRGYGRPFWLPQAQAVAYLDWEWVDQASGLTRDMLWVGRGAPEQTQRVFENVPPASVVIDPDGSLILFTGGDGQPPEVPEAARRFFQVQSLPFAPDAWRYQKYQGSVPSNLRYQGLVAARRPGGSHVAFYTDPYLFLFDNGRSTVCEVDLGVGPGEDRNPLFPIEVKWSPNGRYLAMITTARFPGQLLPFSWLMVLDTVTGDLTRPQLPVRYVEDMEWAPNSQHLLALGYSKTTPGGFPDEKLFLVDVVTADSRAMLPQYSGLLGIGSSGWQMAWSPDAKEVAILCLLLDPQGQKPVQERACLISTRIRP